MKINIHGVYETTQEAASCIDALKKEGFSSNDISVVLNDEEAGAFLSHKTKVSFYLDDMDRLKKDENGFMDNVTDMLAGTPGENERRGHIKDTLLHIGLSEEETSLYTEDIDRGKLLIVTRTTR